MLHDVVRARELALRDVATAIQLCATSCPSGDGELAILFVPMSLAVVTSRREKRASLWSFRKWCRRHL